MLKNTIINRKATKKIALALGELNKEVVYVGGGIDPRTSHDFEDIVYILNYTSNLKEFIIDASDNLKHFLKEAFQKILDSSTLQEAVIGNLYYEDQITRFDKIINLLKDINNDI